MGPLASRRNALVFSLGWWVVRRRLRRRARAALDAVPLTAASRGARRRRPLMLLALLAGAGYAVWRSVCAFRGGGRGRSQGLSDRPESRSAGTG